MAGETQHEAVGVGGRHRHLPTSAVRIAVPARRATQAASVLGSMVVRPRSAWREIASATWGSAWPGHRAGVTEAEVDELVPVDVGEPRPVGLADEQRKGPRPTGHPRHRDARRADAGGRRWPTRPIADAVRRSAVPPPHAVPPGASGRSSPRTVAHNRTVCPRRPRAAFQADNSEGVLELSAPDGPGLRFRQTGW